MMSRELAECRPEPKKGPAKAARVYAVDLKARLERKRWMPGAVIVPFHPDSSGWQHDVTGFAASVQLDRTGDRAVSEDPAAAMRALKAREVEKFICHKGAHRIRWKRFRHTGLRCTE